MGGFFGKGKNKDKGEDKSEPKVPVPAPRASRRAVVPGAAPSTQRVSGPGAGTKPSTQRVVPRPPGQTASVFAKPAPPKTESDNLVLSMDAPVARPDGRAPIMASESPNFSGSLASNARTAGPCRTGDAALIEFMVAKAKLISQEQAELISGKAQREELPLDAAAVSLGVVTEDQLVSALTQECWVPHLKVDKYEIRKKALDTVGKEDAVHYSVFPVDKLGSLLTLAMVNPLDQETIRVLESKTGLDIKRVVATRSEIHQGIEKYYSGQVVAKDTSISFTADAAIETKSVTQLLGNVKTADTAAIGGTELPPVQIDGGFSPEIQDIDDLLSADEIIAPAIIEPVKAIEIEAPLVVPAGEVIEIAEPQIIESSALEARPTLAPAQDDSFTPMPSPFLIDEAPIAAPPVVKAPSTTARIVAAPEFDLEDTDALAPAIKPATEVRPPNRPAQPAVALPPIPPVTPVAMPRRPPTAPVARPPTAPVARPPTASVARPVTGATRPSGSADRAGTASINRSSSMFPARTATGRVANPKIVNLIPVLEEEFQHAITHGKAHVFEKWVGLQSRNRIINAVVVEPEFDDLLAGLYTA